MRAVLTMDTTRGVNARGGSTRAGAPPPGAPIRGQPRRGFGETWFEFCGFVGPVSARGEELGDGCLRREHGERVLREQVALIISLHFRPLSRHQASNRDHFGVNRAQSAGIGRLEALGPSTHPFSQGEPMGDRKRPKRLDFVSRQLEIQRYGTHKIPFIG